MGSDVYRVIADFSQNCMQTDRTRDVSLPVFVYLF